jgi:hypothetical protein
MTDLASLGLAVDLSQLNAANMALGNFAQSGKNAQISTDVLVASAVRLGISVEEVERRLAAANDNLSDTAEQAMKFADATKLAVAANDNFSKSMGSLGTETTKAGGGFFEAAGHALTLVAHLKLLALGAYAMFPAFRGIVNSGLRTAFAELIPLSGILAQAFGRLITFLGPMFSFFASIGAPILAAVALFELLGAVWNKGSALLEKYSNSLRALYNEDTIQNLQKLTKGQGEAGDIISAEQIGRATELGVRLQDASFIIDRFMKTSVIDLTNVSLRLQAVWVGFVEVVAKIAQMISSLPLDKLALIVKVAAASNPLTGAASLVGKLLPETPKEDTSASMEVAKGRLSAMMGVANLASEALDKTKSAVSGLDKELDIGTTFIARFSDAGEKLVKFKDTDSWDRVAHSIERQTARLEANAASAGKDLQFQESLRVEMQLLSATAGGLNAITDEQNDLFIALRVEGFTPIEAALTAGIKLDEKRTKSLSEMGEAAGKAKIEFEQANFAIANQKALDADKISAQALTAFSAAQKGAIAEAQKRLELESEIRKTKEGSAERAAVQEMVDERAASARKLAMDTEIKQLNEISRARLLSANQAVDSAKIEVELLGKTAGQQAEIRANLQARQTLEQQASQNRSKFNDKEYEDLKKINEELGKQAQINAIAKLNDDIKFGRNTSLLSPEDVAIAQQLRTAYPDVAEALNSVQAAGIRTNNALSGLSSTMSSTLTTGFADIIDGTKSVKDGFASMSKSVLRAIEEMIIKLMVVGPLMRSLQSGLGGMFGLGGGGTPAVGLDSLPAIHHSGGIVGGDNMPTRYVHPAYFDGAPKFHSGGIAGDEVPIIAKRGEGVFTQGQMAAMGGGGTKVTLNVIEDTSRAGQNERKQNENGLDLTVFVDAITAKNAANPGSATSQVLDNRRRLGSR